MGSRGAFENVDLGLFNFVIDGQTFRQIGEVDGVKIIIKTKDGSVSAPEFSHSPNSTYAVLQNGMLKYITYYDNNHNQVRSIDFGHEHQKMVPHYHKNLDHTSAFPATKEDVKLAKKISRRFHVKWKK